MEIYNTIINHPSFNRSFDLLSSMVTELSAIVYTLSLKIFSFYTDQPLVPQKTIKDLDLATDEVLEDREEILEDDVGPSDHSQLDLDASHTVIFHQKKNKFVYISPAPPVESLVISGGGAKGIGLPGVIQAMEEYKVDDLTYRDRLVHVVGSSIGAISASNDCGRSIVEKDH